MRTDVVGRRKVSAAGRHPCLPRPSQPRSASRRSPPAMTVHHFQTTQEEEKIMRSSRWMLAFAASAAGLAGAPPVGATPPTTTIEQRHVRLLHGDCGSFALIFEADVERKVTPFYDRAGVPVRDVLVRRTDGSVPNSVTGRPLPTTGVWRVTRYYADGQLTGRVTQAGPTYLITVPGLGVIFHQTGYGIQQDGQTIFEAGPHDFEHSKVDELCAYPAG